MVRNGDLCQPMRDDRIKKKINSARPQRNFTLTAWEDACLSQEGRHWHWPLLISCLCFAILSVFRSIALNLRGSMWGGVS